MNEILNKYFNKIESDISEMTSLGMIGSERLDMIRPERPDMIRPDIIIPEIIIPLQKLPVDYGVFDITDGNLNTLIKRQYDIYMTHILIKQKKNVYYVYGLYYHDINNQNQLQMDMIKDIIINNNPLDSKVVIDVNSNDFWNDASRYFIVGTIFLTLNSNEENINIHKMNTWNLEKKQWIKNVMYNFIDFF